MTEELTAEERANLLTGVSKAKLLRLYDAALARAEAAEGYWDGWMKDCTLEQEKRELAESRLASATALLRSVVPDESRTDDRWNGRRAAFLSATPAPAAPCPSSCYAEQVGINPTPAAPIVTIPANTLVAGQTVRLEADGFYAARVHPETAPAAESDPDPRDEHTNAAIDEHGAHYWQCRAEMAERGESNMRATESAYSGEIVRLRDRIAGLERELAAAREAGRAQGRDDVGKYSRAIGEIEGLLGITTAVPLSQTVAAVRALRAAIDAAADMLAKHEPRTWPVSLARSVVQQALSLLRAAQKAAT